MTAPPRSAAQRRRDAMQRLDNDVDAWVATADPVGGAPSLVPLSFWWDGAALMLATPASSPTGRNLLTSGRVRVGVGPTRDVLLIDGTATPFSPSELPPGVGDAFAAKAGFDPRRETGYLYFLVAPTRIRAWREANELAGRDLMRGGEWLDA